MSYQWYILDLQPEPWTAPSVSVGKKGGRAFPRVYQSAATKSYKEAVQEELAAQAPVIVDGLIALRFILYRALPVYVSDEGNRVRKHKPDVTNLQKLLEDACQGVLYANDKNVRDIHTTLMEMENDTKPKVIIGIAPWVAPELEIDLKAVWMDEAEPAVTSSWDVREMF